MSPRVQGEHGASEKLPWRRMWIGYISAIPAAFVAVFLATHVGQWAGLVVLCVWFVPTLLWVMWPRTGREGEDDG